MHSTSLSMSVCGDVSVCSFASCRSEQFVSGAIHVPKILILHRRSHMNGFEEITCTGVHSRLPAPPTSAKSPNGFSRRFAEFRGLLVIFFKGLEKCRFQIVSEGSSQSFSASKLLISLVNLIFQGLRRNCSVVSDA